jgi:hypothetical protein
MPGRFQKFGRSYHPRPLPSLPLRRATQRQHRPTTHPHSAESNQGDEIEAEFLQSRLLTFHPFLGSRARTWEQISDPVSSKEGNKICTRAKDGEAERTGLLISGTKSVHCPWPNWAVACGVPVRNTPISLGIWRRKRAPDQTGGSTARFVRLTSRNPNPCWAIRRTTKAFDVP